MHKFEAALVFWGSLAGVGVFINRARIRARREQSKRR